MHRLTLKVYKVDYLIAETLLSSLMLLNIQVILLF